MIPAIKFDVTPDVTKDSSLAGKDGLINNGNDGKGKCLRNIDYYHGGDGTCFNINDRQDEYDSRNNKSTSSYDASAVNTETGLINLDTKHFVFGDLYNSEVDIGRSALNRKYDATDGKRYNRNVASYVITKGDLKDKTGNYAISFFEGVTYAIKSADLVINPEEEIVTGTLTTMQYKVYGEKDKEITFEVLTKYTASASYYAKYNSNIIAINGNDISSVKRYNASFEETVNGDYIKIEKNDVITLIGFAYDENGNTANLNYGVNKTGLKAAGTAPLDQSSITGSIYYDTACVGIIATDVECNTTDKTLKYKTATTRILLGYLYVNGHNQSAKVHSISNGLIVAKNEFGSKNYLLDSTNVNAEGATFMIIPRPVALQIKDVSKIYGSATDRVSCDDGVSCPEANTGLTASDNEGYLRYNFNEIGGDKAIEATGSNSALYSGAYGIVKSTNSNYSAYKEAEDKNSMHLGVYVSRDERNTVNDACMYDGDKFGFCEDVGAYYLRMYGYENTIDNITSNEYQNVYRLKKDYTFDVTIEGYYYGSYFGYNPNYFVVVVNSDASEAVLSDVYEDSGVVSTSRDDSYVGTDKLLKATATLTINKKDVKIYVNTTFSGDKTKIYDIQQNTVAPSLPTVANNDLMYETFESNREGSVYSSNTYGNVIWGRHNGQVRTGDKLVGNLAYCNLIITETQYNKLLTDGLENTDYTSCSSYKYNPGDVDTNLTGYVPIVRESSVFGINNQSATSADKNYESNNYSVTFYPGALRIERDDTKPVVQVNREDVYIEANALGTYIYECVGNNKSTTYKDC